MSMTMKQAKALREAMIKASEHLDDATASTAPAMFGTLPTDGSLVKAGTRINWGGVVKKAAVDLWALPENNPDNAPTIWEDLPYRDGIRVIPETITVTGAFSKGELGWWVDGNLYESIVDNNVYTPAQYAANWQLRGV